MKTAWPTSWDLAIWAMHTWPKRTMTLFVGCFLIYLNSEDLFWQSCQYGKERRAKAGCDRKIIQTRKPTAGLSWVNPYCSFWHPGTKENASWLKNAQIKLMCSLRDAVCWNSRIQEVFVDHKNVSKTVCCMISLYRNCYLKYVYKNL